jgi:integrase
MVLAARAEPTGRQQMFCPVRDVALLRFLAGTGARAEEICGATIGEIDRRPERPIWRVGRSRAASNATSRYARTPSMPSTSGSEPAGLIPLAGHRDAERRCSCEPTAAR